jgi:hypothetical protein
MNKGLNLGRQKETGPHLEWKALMICYGINNSSPNFSGFQEVECIRPIFQRKSRFFDVDFP